MTYLKASLSSSGILYSGIASRSEGDLDRTRVVEDVHDVGVCRCSETGDLAKRL